MEQFEFRELVAEDAIIIGEAEKLIYGKDNPGLINGAHDIEGELLAATNGNFSVGAFDVTTGKLVGYVMCYPDLSSILEDEIAYISDFAVLKQFRKNRFANVEQSLVTNLFSLVSIKARKHKLPIEAEFRKASYRLIKNRQDIIRNLGYRITDEQILPKYRADEDFYQLRLELFV